MDERIKKLDEKFMWDFGNTMPYLSDNEKGDLQLCLQMYRRRLLEAVKGEIEKAKVEDSLDNIYTYNEGIRDAISVIDGMIKD